MERLNRNINRPQQQNYTKKTSRFIRNQAVVTKLLSKGYLPIQHNSLPIPFRSFEVETNAGKRYVLQVRGRQAMQLEFEVGYTVDYDGKFIFGREINGEWHGGFFLASSIEVLSKEIDPYIIRLQIAQEAITRAEAEDKQ
jgi:hypothetical protein